jgi:hypothetical protein
VIDMPLDPQSLIELDRRGDGVGAVSIWADATAGLVVAGLVELAEAATSNRSGGFQPKRAAPNS